ncbi:MAG: glutathione S-transferase N-terminal domain-containing protein [Kangiellaceae bacterium]|jgi:glutaredoxin 2|nr:glutathione S-transferase N-terminal domain-containing protein [Kangiellaceae bacterium]
MAQYQLYYYNSCPFCQFVLQALPNVNVEVELKDILRDFDNRNELMAGGGKTQVPCLRIINDDGEQWMYESADIIRYLNSL